jgi:hypothetical protein
MTHLGGRVYDLMQRGVNVENDEQVKLMIGNLRKLEEELSAREREIDDLRSSRRGSETADDEVAVVEGPDETQSAEEEEETPR